ncbi:hypothetical protein KPATCC21470_2938 [Kitasatospora purpeofusca]
MVWTTGEGRGKARGGRFTLRWRAAGVPGDGRSGAGRGGGGRPRCSPG